LTAGHDGRSAFIRNPHDRFDTLRPVVEKLGRTVNAFFVLILEMPDEASAAALAVAAGWRRGATGHQDYATHYCRRKSRDSKEGGVGWLQASDRGTGNSIAVPSFSICLLRGME